MTTRGSVTALAVVLALVTPATVGGFAVTNEARLDVTGAGALAVASCQLIVLANAFAGATTVDTDAADVVEAERSRRSPFQSEDVVKDASNATCSQNVPRMNVTIARSPSWGEPAPGGLYDGSFSWHGTRELTRAAPTDAEWAPPDTAANVVHAHLAGEGTAAAACQLLVGVDVFIAAGPAIGGMDEPGALGRPHPGDAAVNATEHASASCETIVHSLRVHLTH